MIYGRDYGIKDVQWCTKDLVPLWKRILSRIPGVRNFFTQKVRIDFTALTKEGRPIMGTFCTVHIPLNTEAIRFMAALGGEILCHGAEKVMYYVTDMEDHRLGEGYYTIAQAGISRWHLYIVQLKKGEQSCSKE